MDTMYVKYQVPQLPKSWAILPFFNPLNTVVLLALVPFFLLTGCVKGGITTQESETVTQESSPHVSPYVDVVVTDVEIRYLETAPVQVELVIRGTLPDQCKYNFYSVENRRNQNIKISVKGRHPAEGCEQISQAVEYILLLGRDMPESERGFTPGNYTLSVNKYQTVFTIKEK
jgi:hypothetical protein